MYSSNWLVSCLAGVPTLRYIPYSPDPGFAGRKGILEGLYRAFSVQDKHTRIALYGLGGIGYVNLVLISSGF